MGPTEQQIGGDTGDIIIGSAPDKPKMSRPLVLGIIVGVLVLIGGAVATVVLLNQGKSGGGSQVVTKVDEATVQSSFQDYETFILGDKITEQGKSFDLFAQYNMISVLRNTSQSEKVQYLQSAQEKLEKFAGLYGNSSVYNENAQNYISESLTNLIFLRQYHEAGSLSMDQIIERYNSDGLNSAIDLVNTHFANLSNSDSYPAQRYAKLFAEYWT
ncbi:hypothetical protein IKG16_02450, partial [Candidatus Saccharibacteria bacterium]|nr:hypothetical protein [Candidatus Saccharibacteria bacterium]